MAHFAKLNENNEVVEVHTIANAALDSANEETSGIEFLVNWSGGHTNWKQTSYNATFRKNYASPGDIYDANLDAFISPRPFHSWKLNEISCKWEAPIPKPENGVWYWDEQLGQWIEPKTL